MKNFKRAPRECNYVRAYDNTPFGFAPLLVLKAELGRITYILKKPTPWLQHNLARLGPSLRSKDSDEKNQEPRAARDNIDIDR